MLHGDLLIVPCLGTDVRYMAALDKRTGEVRWKQTFAGRNARIDAARDTARPTGAQLISNQADRIVALDPATGARVVVDHAGEFRPGAAARLRPRPGIRRRRLLQARGVGDSPRRAR